MSRASAFWGFVGVLTLVACEKPIVEGEGLLVQDVSADGTLLAYIDSSKTLFIVPVLGGEPQEVIADIDEASFKGGFLLAFSGINGVNENADTVTVFTITALEANDLTPAFSSTNVSLGSARVSDDGAHLFYETRNITQEAVLDGQEIVAGAVELRGRFSPLNDLLIVSSELEVTGTQLQAFPLDGSAPIDLSAQCGSGCSNRFQITEDGASLLIGANENGDFADLVSLPIAGGAGTLVVQAGDNGFSFLNDGQTLIFIDPDPNNTDVGALSSIAPPGAATALGPQGVLDTSSTGKTSLVYITALDINTGLATLRFINADGSGDIELGTDAKDEGYTSKDAFFLFLDKALFNALTRETIGSFRALDTSSGSIVDFSDNVKKVSKVGAERAAFLKAAGALQLGDLNRGSTKTLAREVNNFVVFDKNNIAFSVGSGNAGIFVQKL